MAIAGAAFVVREGGRRLATPLLAVLVAIETTDIMFALDSIPAVFAVTTDPFIAFSSNLFAILGLRSLYFLLAGLIVRFVYLKVGLAALLVFAGLKILIGSVYKIPIAVSLGVILAILGIAIVASLVVTHPRRRELMLSIGRIASGVALGAGALMSVATAAAVRDGEAWPTVAMAAGIIAGAGAALAVGTIGLRRSVAPQSSWAAVRIGAGVCLGAVTLGLLAGLAFVRDADASWLLLDLALLLAILAAGALGIAWLRRRSARPSLLRAWAIASIGLLVVAGLAIVLD